jgi:tetratricopeptide (TPR) repeat protein
MDHPLTMSPAFSPAPAPAPAPALAGRARRPSAWLLLLIALVAVAVYANSLKNGFAYDDVGIIQANKHVVDLNWSTIWADNYWPTTDGLQPDLLYRPLTLWSYLANQAISPGVPWPFHLVNVLLHALVTVLVCQLTWRLLGDRTVAAVAALLFAVHPLHAEAVANTVGRAELLAATWTLLALLIYLPSRPLADEAEVARRPWWHGPLVAACFFAAILCKETPATLLPAIVLLDLWRRARLPRDTRPALPRWLASRALRYYLPLVLAFGLYLLMRVHACGLMTSTDTVHPVVNPLVRASALERVVTPFGLLARYLALTFWPAHLSADYSAPSILPTANPLTPFPAAGLLGLLLAAILCVRSWRKAPQLTLVVGLFLTSYLLVANVVRIGTIFGERLFYWPSAFVLMLTAWAAVAACRRLHAFTPAAARAVAAVALVAALGAMSWRTAVRNTDWADNIPLAIATGRDNPRSAKACHWAGTILIIADRADYVAIGKDLLERAAELYPEYAGSHWELAKYYGRQKNLPESLIHLTRAVRYEPGTHMTRLALSSVFQDLKAAAPDTYLPALEANAAALPDDPSAHLALAMAYHALGRYEPAMEQANKALAVGQVGQKSARDQFHEAAAELASIYFDKGDIETAVSLFRQYTMCLRQSIEARCIMTAMLLQLDAKKFPDALAEAEMNLSKARALEPSNRRMLDLARAVDRARADRRRPADGATASALPAPHAGPAGPVAGAGGAP